MRQIASTLILALVFAALVGCGASPQLKGTAIEPPKPAPDFTLTDEQGQPFTLSAQQGKVTVLFFGFTTCPDICPTELSNLAAATRQLGDDAKNVQVAFVSLDPERDTVERLSQYVSAFDPSFKGLRGEKALIDPITKEYGAFYERRDLPGSALGYTIDHSTVTYVIDKAGRWREVLAYGAAVEDIVADLRALARERG
ncbi:MAG: SCO family protein [Chloroflexales bacterium]|nr:SCO family protein [Chloroflexales bacterium]